MAKAILRTSKKSDLTLIEQIKAGKNVSAETELVKRYQNALFFWLLKKVRNPEDAKEIMFASFTKALVNIHKYDSKYAFGTWLYTIANHKWIDHIRSVRNRPLVVSFDKQFIHEEEGMHSIELPSTGLTPEESMIKLQQIERLKKVIETLKPSYRDVVKLRYFEEYSYKEISAQLNIPVGTAKVHMLRAKKALRKYMLAS